MARYRIGNDMTILWSINDRNGTALPLDGKEVHLYYTNNRGRFEADIEIQDGNVVVWHFLSREQRVLGSYTLTLEIFSNEKRAIKKDLCNAFVLVGKQCEENYDSADAYIYEGGEITLATDLDIYRISPIMPYIVEDESGVGYWYVDGINTGQRSKGETAYEYAVSQGYEGTEEEFAELLGTIPFEKGEGENSAVLKGGDNQANGLLSTTFGRKNKSIGPYGHSEGEFNESIGARAHSEGCYTKAEGADSHAENEGSIARGINSHAEGYYTLASGITSHTEGASRADDPEYNPDSPAYATVEKYLEARGQRSHAEGYATQAFGNQSHAEGIDTLAEGTNSHAEGQETQALSNNSHSEGNKTIAKGADTHAEGYHTTTNGWASHAEGIETYTTNQGEHAQGKYNLSTKSSSASEATIHSIGIGNSSKRKNAQEVKSDGKHYIIGIGGYDGTNPTEATDLASVISTQNTTIADAITRQDTTITERFDEQDAQILNKADKDGNYPDLTSGFADNLVGRGESVPAEFSFRASGGRSILDGTARIKELRGNAVVWNQKVEKTYIEQDTVLYNIDGIPQNHKFALIRSKAFGGCYYFPSSDIYDYLLTDGEYAKIFVQSHVLDAEYSRIYSIAESGYIQLIDLTKMFGAGNEPSTIEEFYSRCPLGVDMNAYNEGEMIADNSTAIKSIGDNAWDEQWELGRFSTATGENVESPTQIRAKNLIRVLPNSTYYLHAGPSMPFNDGIWIILFDNNGDVIQGFNGGAYTSDNSFICYPNTTFTTAPNAAYMRFYATEGYGATYNNDITISLYHSGWKAEVDNVYKPYVEFTREIDQRILDAFPNGRKPWDKVYNKNGKGYIVKGTGEVDLGSLSWAALSINGYEGFISRYNDLGACPSSTTNTTICPLYVNAGLKWYQEGADKCVAINHYYYSPASVSDSIAIRDTAYTDVDTFKTAMQGVTLWYELAEPEIIEYDEPFNLDYEVWDFGTEQIIAEAPSAPINANIIYQFNAVDMIRDHEARIAELEALIASLTNG